jgi:hypothetical protein
MSSLIRPFLLYYYLFLSVFCQGAIEQEAISAEDNAKQAAIAAGKRLLEETLIATDDGDALGEVIPLEDSDNPKEEDEEDELVE